ncbi:uncharacterized protein METZ01_LOCUS124213, partial [marine metagenome]
MNASHYDNLRHPFCGYLSCFCVSADEIPVDRRVFRNDPSRRFVDRGHGAGSSFANERVFVLEESAGGLEG